MSDIADLRKSYERAELDEAASEGDPMKQFGLWLQQALDSQLPEPNAMTLATVGDNGRPSTRVVLIKGYDERGIAWYTNYHSRKGARAGRPALRCPAISLGGAGARGAHRRFGGTRRAPKSRTRTTARGRSTPDVGAWASPQSEVISSRAVLVANAAKFGAQYLLNPPRPPHWGGYRLKPDTWEFWQGRKSRLHDRLRYRLDAGHWVRERLAP